MPEISVRGVEMPESPIRKLAPLAAAAKKRGTKVYHLNIGQPDLPTPQVALDALKALYLQSSLSVKFRQFRNGMKRLPEKFSVFFYANAVITQIIGCRQR